VEQIPIAVAVERDPDPQVDEERSTLLRRAVAGHIPAQEGNDAALVDLRGRAGRDRLRVGGPPGEEVLQLTVQRL
jgi:hypothetical protein